jgi:hypothetical protein
MHKSEIIKRIYEEMLRSYNDSVADNDEFNYDISKVENAIVDIKGRLTVKLITGKCSSVLINQIALHHCGYGEIFEKNVNYYNSRVILDKIGYTENKKVDEEKFKYKNSLIYGLWKVHHNGFSQSYSYIRNVKEYWFKRDGEPKRDFTPILNKYPDNLGAALIAMNQIALSDKAKNNDIRGEWIVYAKVDEVNYYLCLATHSEKNDNDKAIYDRIIPCFKEFPELNNILKL